MGLDDPKIEVAETPIKDPEAQRKAERAAELKRLMGDFEARMQIRADPIQTESLEENRPPEPLSKDEAMLILEESRSFLSGPRKIDYFGIASGWDRLKLKGLPNYSQALIFLRGLLPIFKNAKKNMDQVLMRLIVNPEAGHTTLLCLLQWLYLKEHFPWTQNDLSEDERNILNEIEKAIQRIFAAMPGAADIFIGIASEHADMTITTAAILAGSRGMPGFSDERFLQETAFTGNDFKIACDWLNLEPADIRACVDNKEGNYLDLGCGLSDFSVTMRERGAARMFTLDDLSVEELIRKVRGMNEAVRQGLHLEKPLRALEAKKSEREAWHRKGASKNTHRIFGEGFFKSIFAVDSITQPALCPVYRRNPRAFWGNMAGPLRALSPECGELRATTNPYILYSQTDMEAYWLPFLLALRAGRFEIQGTYDAQGRFSFEKFMNRYVVWKPELVPAFRVRRHPSSDPNRVASVMEHFLTKKPLETFDF